MSRGPLDQDITNQLAKRFIEMSDKHPSVSPGQTQADAMHFLLGAAALAELQGGDMLRQDILLVLLAVNTRGADVLRELAQRA
jgi:hypothetical protein